MPISILHCWSTGKPYQIFEGYHRLIQPSLHNALNAKTDLERNNKYKISLVVDSLFIYNI